MKKDDLQKMIKNKGLDGALEALPCSVDKHPDPCHSQKNAVKIACKNVDPLNPDDTCSDALDALAECMTENY